MTTFDDVLRAGWNDHATDASGVASRIEQNAALATEPGQMAALAQLAAHVFAEHLGDWGRGIAFLTALRASPALAHDEAAAKAVARSLAAVKVASGDDSVIAALDRSSQVRVLAVAASAVTEREVTRAQKLFSQALDLSGNGLSPQDPAQKSLAITGNNLACQLEDKAQRTAVEIELMLLAARTARRCWELAGTWLEVERAEYRLAMSCLKAGLIAEASQHARECQRVCTENRADALEHFFANEALALAARAQKNDSEFADAFARMRENFQHLSADDQGWCAKSLQALEVSAKAR